MERVNFEVDSALLSELGERLVGSVHVALMELIKNSYDADATFVKVSVERQGTGILTRISDNGVGMTFEQVKKYWMRIATTNKVVNNISLRYGRPKSGAKGIGRFSCRRLGACMRIMTTSQIGVKEFETTEFFVDWMRFLPGTTLSNITVECNRRKTSSGASGTKLEIVSDNSQLFDKRTQAYVKRNSAILVGNRGVTRPGFEPDPGFNISFNFFGSEEAGEENLRDLIFKAGWGYVVGKIDDAGIAKFALDAIGVGHQEYTADVDFPALKGAELRIGALVEEKEQIRDSNVVSKTSMREMLASWGGVFVRYNGVRVEPYGEEKDDWLNIDRDRGLRRGASAQRDIVSLAKGLKGINPNRYLLTLLSSRSYVGDVWISARNEGFQIKASREGFLQNDAFEQLRGFARLAVDYLTLYRDKYLREKAEEELRQNEDELKARVLGVDLADTANIAVVEPLDFGLKTVGYIRRIANNIPHVGNVEKLRDVAQELNKATEFLERREKNNADELLRLRLLASSSVLLSLFSHDVRVYIDSMEKVEIELKNLAQERDRSKIDSRLKELSSEIKTHRKDFNDLIDMTLAIAVPDASVKAEKMLVLDRLKTVLSCFRGLMDDYEIECIIDGVAEDLYVGPLLPPELYSILINVISNSIKAVIASDSEPRRIEIVGAEVAGKSEIRIRDSGIGVDLSNAVRLFDPYTSDPAKRLYPVLNERIDHEHAFVLGTGSGLGLNIIKQIIDARKGDIAFVTPAKGWKTELAIKI